MMPTINSNHAAHMCPAFLALQAVAAAQKASEAHATAARELEAKLQARQG